MAISFTKNIETLKFNTSLSQLVLSPAIVTETQTTHKGETATLR